MRGCGPPQVKFAGSRGRIWQVRGGRGAECGVIVLASRPMERKHCGCGSGESPLPRAALAFIGVVLGMGSLTVSFVALCMVRTGGSLGAVLYLRFALTGAYSPVVALAAHTALAL